MVLHQLEYHLDMVSESKEKMTQIYLQELNDTNLLTRVEVNVHNSVWAMYYVFLKAKYIIQLPVRRLKASTVESGY